MPYLGKPFLGERVVAELNFDTQHADGDVAGLTGITTLVA
jgi:hypothetical protein